MSRRAAAMTSIGVVAALTACGSTVELSTTNATGPATGGLAIPTTGPAGGVASGGATTGGPGVPGPGTTVPAGTGPAAVGPASTGSTPGGTGPTTSTGRPVANHSPITVGFMYSINDGAATAGVNNHQTVDLDHVTHALVASYNKSGGFAGRHINAVYASIKSSSNNYEGDLAAACATFTQDHHVAAVISNLGYYSDNFFSCLARAGVPVISGDTGPDAVDARNFPLLVTPDAMLGDTRVREVVDRLTAAGILERGSRVGVVIEGCPVNQRIYRNALAPELRQQGLVIAGTAQPECFQGISGLGTIAGQMTNAVVAFRQRNVGTVIFVSQAQEGTMSYEFMLAAGNQSWYPAYALSSATHPVDVEQQSGVPQREFAQAHGVGWSPYDDTSDPRQAPTTAAERSCISRVRAEGLQPSTATDYLVAFPVCDTFALYAEALAAESGDSSPAALMQGVEALKSSYTSALALDGAAGPWDHGRIAPAHGRLFSYVASRGGFVYTGRSFAF